MIPERECPLPMLVRRILRMACLFAKRTDEQKKWNKTKFATYYMFMRLTIVYSNNVRDLSIDVEQGNCRYFNFVGILEPTMRAGGHRRQDGGSDA